MALKMCDIRFDWTTLNWLVPSCGFWYLPLRSVQSLRGCGRQRHLTAHMSIITVALRASLGFIECKANILCQKNGACHDRYEDVGCIPQGGSLPFCPWGSLPETYLAFLLRQSKSGTPTFVELTFVAGLIMMKLSHRRREWLIKEGFE